MFRGTVQKSAVPCGFRECGLEIAKRRVGREQESSCLENVDPAGELPGLDRVLPRRMELLGVSGVFIIALSRAKGRMYARVRIDLSGVIRIRLKRSSEVLVNHVAFARLMPLNREGGLIASFEFLIFSF